MHTVKHALRSFLVADFKPSRGVETYSEAVFYASVRDGVDLVSHKAMLS